MGCNNAMENLWTERELQFRIKHKDEHCKITCEMKCRNVSKCIFLVKMDRLNWLMHLPIVPKQMCNSESESIACSEAKSLLVLIYLYN